MSKQKNALVLINPVAGKKKIRKAIFDLLRALAQYDYEPSIHMTKARREATDVTAACAARYDLVVCCGGDGTLNEVISGLLRLPKDARPLLFYYPCGSTNDFATTLGLPKKIDLSAFDPEKRKVLHLDIGTLNGEKHFSYITSFGIFTKASFSANQKVKNKLGHLAYILEGAKELPQLHKTYHAKITYDDGVIEGDYAMVAVSNSTSAGGVLHLPADRVSLDDGLFEVLLIKGLRRVSDTAAVLDKLIKQRYDGKNIILLKTAHVTIECREAPSWCVDGEYAGDIACGDIVCEKGAVRILV